MAKINWDYEKTSSGQRLMIMIGLLFASLIIGMGILTILLSIISAETAVLILAIIVVMDNLIEAWNKWSPWAGREGENAHM